MPFYLCRFVTVPHPVLGGVVRQPKGVADLPVGTAWSAVDLSSDGRGGGRDLALVGAAATIPAQVGVFPLGAGGAVSVARRQAVADALGVTVAGATLRDVVEEVLDRLGHVVTPDAAGRRRVHLGGAVVSDRA